MKTYFDHERLDVYQESIAFCGWVGELLSEITPKAAAKDQLERASTSLPLNIAEGNRKLSTLAVQHWSVEPAWTSLRCESLFVQTESHPQKNN